ncbi:hypothetical protein MKW98_020794 [Papaver atlanticum]|uniref:TNase-like domain-containing protein n=1 Tax=Papaver atlanticum TaxID=357466 RepID=A0AAD4TIC2_9MAGN|nr:hypothetical protein MKW98_020794 [Papaver atlanticum]
MGNALSLKSLFGNQTNQESDSVSGCVSALAHDLAHFQITSQVPEGLNQHVASSKKAQAKWYNKLLLAWREANPPPKTPEQASRLVIQTLKQNNVDQGLLKFYSLPIPHDLIGSFPPPWPKGVIFELRTLPVDARAVADGDGLTVYVDVADPREAANVPREVLLAVSKRSIARASRDYLMADGLQRKIAAAGYRVLNGSNNEDVLAKKYRIRLRGIDAPENQMPYGLESKVELTYLVQGKCLVVHVYGEDQYGRLVGDVYCNGKFAQEIMLKKGLAWHYKAYDNRPELIKWEKDARVARVGLWAASNPEKPWEWRKANRQGRGILELIIDLFKLMADYLFRGNHNTKRR